MFNYIQRRHKMAISANDAPLRTHFLSKSVSRKSIFERGGAP